MHDKSTLLNRTQLVGIGLVTICRFRAWSTKWMIRMGMTCILGWMKRRLMRMRVWSRPEHVTC